MLVKILKAALFSALISSKAYPFFDSIEKLEQYSQQQAGKTKVQKPKKDQYINPRWYNNFKILAVASDSKENKHYYLKKSRNSSYNSGYSYLIHSYEETRTPEQLGAKT